MMNQGDLCLVTGASGYLASWLTKYLLERGYRVRGTVRSLDDPTRVQALEALLPGIELVAADLRDEAGWREAVDGCQWIFHVASPQAVKSERDRTGGAISGMGYLLTAAFASSTVRKIVFTSSVAAIAYGHPRSKRSFNEDDWTVLGTIKGNSTTADYFRSKTLAERLAWDLAADSVRNPRRIPLVAVNPGLILGPSLVPWGRFSLDTFRDIAQGKSPLMVDMDVNIVDVRDCARMHIALMKNSQANGRRHLAMATSGKMVDLARIVRHDYGHMGYTPSTRVSPQWLLRLLSLVSSEVACIYSHIGNPTQYRPQHPEAYTYEYVSLEGVVRDTMDSLLAHGGLRITAEISQASASTS